MGSVYVKLKLTNYDDIANAKSGYIGKDKIRTYEGEGLIDSGARMLSIPKSVFEKLGLDYTEKEVTTNYANGIREKRKIVRGILIEINGREAVVECLVEEKYDKILVGQIPLEYMDWYIDLGKGELVPRPESPDMPMIDMLLVEKRL